MLLYNKKSLRIIFAGTSEFSKYYLDSLLYSGYKVISVITKPDNRMLKNHKNHVIYNAVKEYALKNKIMVLQPYLLQEDNNFYEKIKNLSIDIMIVVDYGNIFPKKILNIPKLGCINIHASLLPRWRGPAPIHRAICTGDNKTGISIIKMNEQIDYGNILMQKECSISYNDTTGTMYKKLFKIGKNLLLELLSIIIKNNEIMDGIPQNNINITTYASKVKKSESRINWNLSAKEIDCYIRAFNPWPLSYFMFLGKRIQVLSVIVLNEEKNDKYCNYISKFNIRISKPGTILCVDKKVGVLVSTGDGVIILKIIKLEGKKEMHISEFLNSKQDWFYKGCLLN